MTIKMIAAAAALILAATSSAALASWGDGVTQPHVEAQSAVRKAKPIYIRPHRQEKESRCSHHGCQVAQERSHAGPHQSARHAQRDAGKHERHQSHGIADRTLPKIATQIVAHPAGCPRTSFCGCGAALEVFGRSIRELWLAANWFRFPKAEPAPGMVAVRQHHVFVIRKVLKPGVVLAYDPNSGRHLTRVHVRSLSGYSVRNPHGSVLARAG